jgi:hypothetical protein
MDQIAMLLKPGTRHPCRPYGLLLVFVPVMMLSCSFNPFLPGTGEPLPVKNTPSDVINQLLRSYETRSISTFKEILPPDNSFRFYVSPTFFTEYQANPTGILLNEQIDSGYTNVPPGVYHYWRQDDEVKSHQNLFDRVYSLNFTTQPIFNSSDFVFHLDSLGDTLGVEVLMRSGEFEVMYKEAETDFYYILQPVYIERQVFYLVKDPEGLWVIGKWFDFGVASEK